MPPFPARPAATRALAALLPLAPLAAARPAHAQPPAAAPAPAAPLPPPLDSTGRRPIQIGLTLGTTGVGIEVSRLVLGHLGLRVGAAAAGATVSDVGLEDVDGDASLRMLNTHALVDLFPFRRAGFHFTGGVMSVSTRVVVRARPDGATFTVNDVDYPVGEVGTLTGRVSLPRAMPYAGIGFGRPRTFGFRFVPAADIGVAFGRATSELRAENAPSDARLAADVEAERRRIDDDLGKFPYFPVLRTTFAWRF
jgi:hypothetical protein